MAKSFLFRTLLIMSVMATVVSASAIPSALQAAPQRVQASVEGSWTGDFGAGEWTFTFEQKNGLWSGSYTYPQYKGRNPVINLEATPNTAKFSLKAKTYVNFVLKLDPSGKNLKGTVKFEHGTTPDSPPVVVPVSLRRVS